MSVAQLAREVRSQVKSLPPAKQQKFVRDLLGKLEDLLDVAAVGEQREEPTRPWADVRRELLAGRVSRRN